MSEAQKRFAGGVLAVTGGGSGVGEGLARHAASLGMAVAIADIDLDAATTVADELVRAGGKALARKMDVRDLGAMEAFADEVYAELGPVTLAINNAGIEQFGYVWDVPEDNWHRLMNINVTGVFNGVKAFVPRMQRAGVPARIWNLSSMGGVSVGPRQAPYIVSQGSVHVGSRGGRGRLRPGRGRGLLSADAPGDGRRRHGDARRAAPYAQCAAAHDRRLRRERLIVHA
ncbi:SDR family NAD(P)-dependent oxidoreductase [Streptomyces sp. NPDC058067]|uniref:SDR family NAD(P)-dependent oxidoreductase n=1 Tax=Streptomyces sp. NPDC058067 TaxID=3346324 RepID=UPI0036E10A75